MLDMTSFRMINKLAEITNAKKYLEIGVCKGETFLDVQIDHKVAVDPFFQFETEKYTTEKTNFFCLKSDDFFSQFQNLQRQPPFNATDQNFTFDIIFIDGYHSFEQSYRDFENSLNFSHDNTLWIIDDTIPWDPFSAHISDEISLKYRELYGFADRPWHGDVFKTVYAIHEFHHEFSYATHFDGSNAQTILWKTSENAKREELFPGVHEKLQAIQNVDFFELYEHLRVLNPRTLDSIYPLLGSTINDDEFCSVEPKYVIHPLERPIDMRLGKFKDSMHSDVKHLRKEIQALKKDVESHKKHILRVLQRHVLRSRKLFFFTALIILVILLLLKYFA